MSITRRLATGLHEGRLLTELERQGIAVFSKQKHRTLLRDFGDQQLADAVHRLVAKGWLLNIERGKYVVVPRAARASWHEHPFVIASGIAPNEHYISYWSALSFHGLTEQIPRVVYVAVRHKQKKPVSFQGVDYRFISLSDEKFFGFRDEEFMALNGAATVHVPVAEPEKAVIDALDDESLAGGIPEIAKAVRRGLEDEILSGERLLEYGEKYPHSAVAARLGYLLDIIGVEELTKLAERIRRRGPHILLSPKTECKGATVNSKWHIRVNVPEELLIAGEEA